MFQIYHVYTTPDTHVEVHKLLGMMVTKPLARSVVKGFLANDDDKEEMFIRDKQTGQVEWHRQRLREADDDDVPAVLETMLEDMGCKIVDVKAGD